MKKHYKVTIKTIGPLHIGSGQTLRKEEYVYLQNEQIVYILNQRKLINLLKEKKLLDQYLQSIEEFYKDSKKGNTKSYEIKRFFIEKDISMNEWKRVADYSLIMNSYKRTGRKPASMNDLHQFMIDGTGEKYIPGSSIKGALMNILESSIKDEVLMKNIHRNISVKDSKPISINDFEVYQKVDINKKEKDMPIYRECIKPETIIELKLTLNVSEYFSISDLEKHIEGFYHSYTTKWLNGFEEVRAGNKFLKQRQMNSNGKLMIYLGGGVGFVSKTGLYHQFDRKKARKETLKVLSRKFHQQYKYNEEQYINIPKALKGTYNSRKDQWYEQGLCEIKFEEI